MFVSNRVISWFVQTNTLHVNNKPRERTSGDPVPQFGVVALDYRRSNNIISSLNSTEIVYEIERPRMYFTRKAYTTVLKLCIYLKKYMYNFYCMNIVFVSERIRNTGTTSGKRARERRWLLETHSA